MELPELSKYRIGTSGYQFPDWFGTVYPPNLRQRNVLEYYANTLGLDTVEVNYTYYRLPSPRTSEAMARKVPGDFEFVVRSFSGMTHDIWEGTDRKTLKDTTEVFDQFVQGILPFKEAENWARCCSSSPTRSGRTGSRTITSSGAGRN